MGSSVSAVLAYLVILVFYGFLMVFFFIRMGKKTNE